MQMVCTEAVWFQNKNICFFRVLLSKYSSQPITGRLEPSLHNNFRVLPYFYFEIIRPLSTLCVLSVLCYINIKKRPVEQLEEVFFIVRHSLHYQIRPGILRFSVDILIALLVQNNTTDILGERGGLLMP